MLIQFLLGKRKARLEIKMKPSNTGIGPSAALFKLKSYSFRPVHIFRWFLIALCFLLVILWYLNRLRSAHSLPIQPIGASLLANGPDFEIKGQKLKLYSGSLHYFRVVPEYWEDRLMKMKAAGLNTVTTYVPWNLHEPVRGKFHFKDILDVVKFIKTAQKVGLYVIFRPGPYICSEWEFGGLPGWLLHDDEMKIRSTYPLYIDAVNKYFNQLLPMVVDLQYAFGGPIIAFQIENEYGSFGKDKEYLRIIKSAFEKHGIQELLFTSDNSKQALQNGGLVEDGVLLTANFQANVDRHIKGLIELQGKDKPQMVMEFWTGWFDHWGEKHHIFSAKGISKLIEMILEKGASINFYMFHGGTNFGFMNGANFQQAQGHHTYLPTITSYDYDAPIAEDGSLTDKYHIIKTLLQKYAPEQTKNLPPLPPEIKRVEYPEVQINQYMSFNALLEVNGEPIRADELLPMEKLPMNENSGQGTGFLLYKTVIRKKPTSINFTYPPRDRAQIFLNEQPVGVLTRIDDMKEKSLTTLEGGKADDNVLEILVENMGRVNYGKNMGIERKGIIGDVIINKEKQDKWEMFPLEFKRSLMEAVSTSTKWHNMPSHEKRPTLYRAKFEIKGTPSDTFLDMSEWEKGVIFVNGFNLGRYWNKGPQQHYYLPGPLLKSGENEIIIFELHNPASSVKFSDTPNLGPIIHVNNDDDVEVAEQYN